MQVLIRPVCSFSRDVRFSGRIYLFMRQTASRCRLSNGNNVIVPFRDIRWPTVRGSISAFRTELPYIVDRLLLTLLSFVSLPPLNYEIVNKRKRRRVLRSFLEELSVTLTISGRGGSFTTDNEIRCFS